MALLLKCLEWAICRSGPRGSYLTSPDRWMPRRRAGQPSRADERPRITIVLPCYNERGHVVSELERITAAMDASGYT